MDKRECIGILGGMGPAATAYLFQKIIDYTQADGDDGHIPVIIYNNPRIPDRTAAIFGQGPSPLPFLLEGANFLENANVSRIVIPCVTAHYYYDKVAGGVNVPVHHLLQETLEAVIEEHPHITKLGLLATNGTLKTELFTDTFSSRSLAIMTAGSAQQKLVMEAIYGNKGIKQGYRDYPRTLLLSVIEGLIGKGAQAIIAGCTEIPLALGSEHLNLPFVDPLSLIARRLILSCGYSLKD